MRIIRDGEEVECFKEVKTGDEIIADNFEELVAVGRKLSDIGHHYRQLKPMVLTVE